MHLPELEGFIKRRLLINFRVDPKVMRNFLPEPFRPKLHNDYAIAGICLIRLENIRPKWMPGYLGHTSENAAHRIAVLWDDSSGTTREGVFIPRRDTNSRLNHFTGGRIFPGEHHLSSFDIHDSGSQITMSIRSRDDSLHIDLDAEPSDTLPADSCFDSLDASSTFFEHGKVGYSVTKDCCRLDGIRLETHSWKVSPLRVNRVVSSFFEDLSRFPRGSVEFDHALLMRDITHTWRHEPDMHLSENKLPQVVQPA